MSVVIDGTSGITFPDASSQSAAAASGYPAKAWVNFNGTGTVAILADEGVSSITDSGTGRYQVNLSPTISSNHAPWAHGTILDNTSNPWQCWGNICRSIATTSYIIDCAQSGTTAAYQYDWAIVTSGTFR